MPYNVPEEEKSAFNQKVKSSLELLTGDVSRTLGQLKVLQPETLVEAYERPVDQQEALPPQEGVAPIVSFTIQSDPIGEVGINGVQALDMLKYVKCLFESLNEAFPCMENQISIEKIEEAIEWQNRRTQDRLRRKVEGLNFK
jgi:hypothetical protein